MLRRGEGGKRGKISKPVMGQAGQERRSGGGNNRGVVHLVLMARSVKQPAKGEIIGRLDKLIG